MSDEAHFLLNGTVNKHNCRYWSPNNPHNINQRPLHSDRVTVWYAVALFGIIGPYFFEENRVTVTVNSACYIEMITNFLWSELRQRRINCAIVWFQQDGATAHTANESMTIVRNMFPGHLISHFGDVPWPPRSPNLSCDFFLWGYFKSHVYACKPLRWMIWRKPSIRKLSCRSSVVGPCHERFLKKSLKLISFLKLNHLVWHVLSFNFV